MVFFKNIFFISLFAFFNFSIYGALSLFMVQAPYCEQKDSAFKIEQKKEVKDLVRLLDKGCNFKEIYDHARNWRKELAHTQKVFNCFYFGMKRELVDFELFSSLNVHGGVLFLDQLDFLLSKGEFTRKLPELGLYGGLVKRYQVWCQIEGKRIPLTQIIRIEDPVEKLGINYNIYFGESKERRYVWIHTSPVFLNTINTELEKLFDAIINERIQKKSLELIGRFHWWFCQATPCVRGSASIAETLTQSLMKYKGLRFSLKENSFIDLQILSMDNIEEFVKHYRDFYEFEF